MEFVFSDEHEALRSMVREFCADRSAEADVRRVMAMSEGFDAQVWQALADLGLTGLAIPENYGGAGFGPIEVGIVMDEAGAALLCAPYLSSVVLGAGALLAAGDPAANERYLPQLAAGSLRATFALPENDSAASGIDAAETTAGWRLTGEAHHVLDAATAGLLLLVADSPAGPSLFAVEAGAPGVEAAAAQSMDATRRQARLRLADAPAHLVGAVGAAGDVVAAVRGSALALLAAEQVGGAQRALDMAVQYAQLRVQFGRPIGSFQAIKHKCADMLVRVESARSAAYHALWSAADDRPDRSRAAAVAAAYCAQAFYHCAEENILIHGGVGYTWEHPAHLYYKRAVADRVLFGDRAHEREQIAAGLGM